MSIPLPPNDQLALAWLDNADPEEEKVEEAWEAEIGQRVERLDRGEVELLDNDDVLRRIGR